LLDSDNITDFRVFESEKPTNKEIGLKRIKDFWDKYGHLGETPIFLDINNI